MTKWISILVFLLLFNSACKQITETTIESTFDFPLSVGSTWTYATYDSVSLARDTVEVTIIGTTPLSNGAPATLWKYKYISRAETLVVARSSDTVVFSSYTHAPVFVFPLKVGNAWGRQYVDTFTVTSQRLISLPSQLGAIIAYTAFIVDQQSLLPNDFSHFQYWVVPKIGIVRQFQAKFITLELTRTNTSWILLSYSISE